MSTFFLDGVSDHLMVLFFLFSPWDFFYKAGKIPCSLIVPWRLDITVKDGQDGPR